MLTMDEGLPTEKVILMDGIKHGDPDVNPLDFDGTGFAISTEIISNPPKFSEWQKKPYEGFLKIYDRRFD